MEAYVMEEQEAVAAEEQRDAQSESVTALLEELFNLLSRLPDPQNLSDAMKERERKILRDRLKILNAVPRTDWHREFENILWIEIDSWNNGSIIEREVTIGEDPPRADFILVSGEKMPDSVKDVFRIFRKKNAIEYKRPTEDLTERMVWKTGGYGTLLIGTGHDSQYDIDELTLSLFAYRKNEKQFSSMMKRGLVEATAVKGIYRVCGMTPLPYQIVITKELEGREYAAYRALSKQSAIDDVTAIMENMKVSTLSSRDRYASILQTIEYHNPGAVREMIQEDRKMNTIFLDLFEPQIQERERKAAKAAAEQATAAAAAATKAAVAGATEQATAAATAAAYNTFTERLIHMGMDGADIITATGYDRDHIDSIAQSLNCAVSWNGAKINIAPQE